MASVSLGLLGEEVVHGPGPDVLICLDMVGVDDDPFVVEGQDVGHLLAGVAELLPVRVSQHLRSVGGTHEAEVPLGQLHETLQVPVPVAVADLQAHDFDHGCQPRACCDHDAGVGRPAEQDADVVSLVWVAVPVGPGCLCGDATIEGDLGLLEGIQGTQVELGAEFESGEGSYQPLEGGHLAGSESAGSSEDRTL